MSSIVWTAERDKLVAAMFKAEAFYEPVAKSNAVTYGKGSQKTTKYKYAGLREVFESIKPAMRDAGLFFTQQAGRTGADGQLVCVITEIIHAESSQSVTYTHHVRTHRGQGTSDTQDDGSTQTYARRYALLAALGLAPEDDDARLREKKREVAKRKQGADGGPAPAPEAKPAAQEVHRTWTNDKQAFTSATTQLGIKPGMYEDFCQYYGTPLPWTLDIPGREKLYKIMSEKAPDYLHEREERLARG